MDAEVTLFRPFILIFSLLMYFSASFIFFAPPVLQPAWLILTQVSVVLTAVLMLICGLALVFISKPLRARNLLWLPFIYFYWSLQGIIALYAVLLTVLRRPKKWLKTEKKGIVKNFNLYLSVQ